jgi:hypothetical protein
MIASGLILIIGFFSFLSAVIEAIKNKSKTLDFAGMYEINDNPLYILYLVLVLASMGAYAIVEPTIFTELSWDLLDILTQIMLLCNAIYWVIIFVKAVVKPSKEKWNSSTVNGWLTALIILSFFIVFETKSVLKIKEEKALELIEETNAELIEQAMYEVKNSGADFWDSIPANIKPLNREKVYWTPNGKSFHSTEDCVALSRSDEIFHSTLEKAIAMGKTNPCSKCVSTEWSDWDW